MTTFGPGNDYRRTFGGTQPSFLSKPQIAQVASPSRYAVDGIGRDTYIENNNGGLYKGYRPASAMSIGTFVSYKKPEFSLCDIGTKRTNYCNNGTGRDSYIG